MSRMDVASKAEFGHIDQIIGTKRTKVPLWGDRYAGREGVFPRQSG